jgi:hypothetical protein
MEILIPFNLWSIARLKADAKIATSRYKKYGVKGDTFSVNGESYIILLTVKLPLWFIRDYLFKEEGCISPIEFIEIWEDIHPSGFKKDDEVWFHFFDKIRVLIINKKKLEL